MFERLKNFIKRLFLELRKDVKSAIWREKHSRPDCSYNEYLARSF